MAQLLLGGVLVGAGIGAMHYGGMLAMRIDARLAFDPLGFAASIVVAVALAVLALWIRFGLAHRLRLGGQALNLLAGGRVVNLAAAEGHPAAVMDVSFALQALAAEALVRGSWTPGVHPVPDAIEREVAALKLHALDVEIDVLTPEQTAYRSLTSPPRDR